MSNNATDRQTVNTYCDSSFLDAGMLSAPQIHYFAQKYNIIDGFDEKQLKAAVYEMRLGEVAVRWEGKTELRFDLNSGNPSRWDTFLEKASGLDIFPLNYVPTLITSSTLLLPPNSLTFVTTVERFNLPRDIIARFNLKSKLVHKGLLLGTGPIVDPGFKSKIVIPLHNFSNIPLQLKYNEGFISVEFTRTLNPDKDNIDGYDVKRVQNDSANTPVEEFFKNTKYVESSVYSALSQSERMVKRANTTVKRLTGIGIIAILALFIASWSLIDSVYDNSNTVTFNSLPSSNPNLFAIEPAATFLTITSNGIISIFLHNCSLSFNFLIK